MLEINFQKFKYKFLIYCRFISQLDLFLPIIKNNDDFLFVIHSNNINKDEFLRSEFVNFNNCFFLEQIVEETYTDIFDKFLTTDAQNTPSHDYSNKIINSFKSVKKKIIELQHGLSQLGINYFNLPDNKILQDDSLAVNSCADHILSFYDLCPYVKKNNFTVIGYPRTNNMYKSYSGNYNLILSNLHWNAYSLSEKIIFYQQIANCVFENPTELFIWRKHPGEENNISKNLINECFSYHSTNHENIENLIINNENLSQQSTELLIAKSKKIITSYSTVILDCEMYSKPIIIYSTPSLSNLMNKLLNKNTFSEKRPINLSNVNSLVKTGYLKSFNNSNVRKVLIY